MCYDYGSIWYFDEKAILLLDTGKKDILIGVKVSNVERNKDSRRQDHQVSEGNET